MSSQTEVWDVGGQDKIRPLWRHYYQGVRLGIWESRHRQVSDVFWCFGVQIWCSRLSLKPESWDWIFFDQLMSVHCLCTLRLWLQRHDTWAPRALPGTNGLIYVVDSNDRDRIEDAREDSLPDTLDHIGVYRGKLTWRYFFFWHPAEKLPVGHGAFEKNWVETHSSNHECQEFLLHPEVCLPEWLGHIHPNRSWTRCSTRWGVVSMVPDLFQFESMDMGMGQ